MDQPNSYTFTIDKENQSTRIDSVLSLLLPETSRSFIQKLIEGGNLLLNGQVMTSKKYKTCEGDRIEIIVPEPEKLSVEPENIPLDIVYEDDDVLVVNKPKGMVVHPAVGNYTGTLVNAIMYHCGDRLSSINGVIRPGIVHRIDKDTSGLLMIAKNNQAACGAQHYEKIQGSCVQQLYRGQRNGRRTDRKRPQESPQAGGYGTKFKTCSHALDGCRAFRKIYTDRGKAGNGKNTSDQGAYGIYQASACRRFRLRTGKASTCVKRADAACRGAGVCASDKWRIHGIPSAFTFGIPKFT